MKPTEKIKVLPVVSVVIPVCNEEYYLPLCLKSLEGINYPQDKYNIIVVDNGSTDNSVNVAQDYNCKVIAYPEGQTISSVRNKGASHSHGDVLAFLDADCTVSQDWLMNAVQLLVGEVGVVGSRPLARDLGSTWVQRARTAVLQKKDNIRVKWLSSGNFLVMTKYFNEVGGFDETLETCEDADLSYRLRKLTYILYAPDVKANHHREPKTLYEFFRKEIWHGKSSYETLLKSGFKREELLSNFVPLFFFLNLIFLIFAIILGNYVCLLTTLLCVFSVPVAMTFRSLLRTERWSIVHHLFVVDLVYLAARGTSVVSALLLGLKRAFKFLCH